MLTLCKKNSLKSLGFTIMVNLRHFLLLIGFYIIEGYVFWTLKFTKFLLKPSLPKWLTYLSNINISFNFSSHDRNSSLYTSVPKQKEINIVLFLLHRWL